MTSSDSRQLKTVLVTGASGALGSAVVRRFSSSADCRVIATDVRLPQGAEGGQKGNVFWIAMDITQPDSIRQGLASAQVEIDGWVHCAGGFRYLGIEQTTEAELDFLFDLNVRSAFLLARELVPGMKKRGFGRIVFIGARATLQAGKGMAAYAASKSGINALTQSLADEVRDHDINVNAVLPSILDTPANRKDMPQADPSAWVTVDALAEIIHSLTQPWGKPIHGALIPVSGRV